MDRILLLILPNKNGYHVTQLEVNGLVRKAQVGQMLHRVLNYSYIVSWSPVFNFTTPIPASKQSSSYKTFCVVFFYAIRPAVLPGFLLLNHE